MKIEKLNAEINNCHYDNVLNICENNNCKYLKNIILSYLQKNNINIDLQKNNNVFSSSLKKNNKKVIKFTISYAFNENNFLINIWNKMSQDGKGKWNNLQLINDFKEADFIVIVNTPYCKELEYIDKKKSIVLQMEPNMPLHPEMWGEYANPSEKEFFYVINHTFRLNNCEWHLSPTYSQFLNNEVDLSKNKTLSCIFSDRYNSKLQQRRLDFVKFLEKNNVDIDVYGNNFLDYKNYKKPLPFCKKDEGLFPYKYTFNCENYSLKNYLTEKLYDAIMSETLCFYHGCYNAKEYIDERAFIYLNMNDFDESLRIVKESIENNEWEKRIHIIRQEKQKILNELQFFPRMEKIINEEN